MLLLSLSVFKTRGCIGVRPSLDYPRFNFISCHIDRIGAGEVAYGFKGHKHMERGVAINLHRELMIDYM